MLIKIAGPIFRCDEDETIFFSRLYEIPGFDNVRGQGLCLYLNLADTYQESALKELQSICNMWGTSFDIL
jgi:hypothetical protein